MNIGSSFRLIILIALLLCCLTSGCGDPDRARLVGTWSLETTRKVDKRIGAESDSADANRMRIEFRNGGKLTTTTKMGDIDRKKNGSWKFVSYDGDSDEMRIECVLESQKTEHKVKFISENLIKMSPPNMAGVDLQLEFSRR